MYPHLSFRVIQPTSRKTNKTKLCEELFQRIHKFWLHFSQLLPHFSSAVYSKTLQKNCSHFLSPSLPAFLLWIHSNQAFIHNDSILLRRNKRITFTVNRVSLFCMVILVIIQSFCGFNHGVNSVAKCMTKRVNVKWGRVNPYFIIFFQINLRWINYLYKKSKY